MTRALPGDVDRWPATDQALLLLRIIHLLTTVVRAEHTRDAGAQERLDRVAAVNEQIHQLSSVALRLHRTESPAARAELLSLLDGAVTPATRDEWDWAVKAALRSVAGQTRD